MYYHKVRPEDTYDEFLPRLYDELEKTGITHVNIYNDFIKSEEPLYYGTDTHWNKNGVDITIERLLELFQQKKGLMID